MAIQKGDGRAIHVIERQRNDGWAMRANEGARVNSCCRNRRLSFSILLTEPFRTEVGADQIWFGVVLLGQSDAY
jgi:hypothetical protein